MTAEEYLKMALGELHFQLAVATAEVERLKGELAKLTQTGAV